MSVFNDLLVAAAGMASAEVRKLPGPDDNLDSLPLVTACPAPTGEQETPLGFGSRDVVYPVQFTYIRAGDADLASNLDAVLAWRQTLRDLFYLPAGIRALVPSVWQTEFLAAPPLDRRLINQNYDYSAFVVRFSSQEAA